MFRPAKRQRYLTSLLLTALVIGSFETAGAEEKARIWPIQAVDTMKYSRDLAREKLNDPSFDAVIDEQVRIIAETGATHVAIATPYNEEFIPFLTRWVSAARRYDLSVWFRGNTSEWEGWFGYSRYTNPSAHHKDIYDFITSYPGLFREGDIFTPAPEPENGAIRDIWNSEQKRMEFRNFIALSYRNCQTAMRVIGKKVKCGYFSTNGDVARDIFTKDLVGQAGNVVVIDHYVKSAKRLINDVVALNKKFDAPVMLGEFGAPIPDINGQMSENEQAKFIDEILYQTYLHRGIVEGVSYWTLAGGSTSLLRDNGEPKQVVSVLKKYFNPIIVEVTATDSSGKALADISVKTKDGAYDVKTGNDGKATLAFPNQQGTYEIKAESDNYITSETKISLNLGETKQVGFTLKPKEENLLAKIGDFSSNLAQKTPFISIILIVLVLLIIPIYLISKK